MLSWRLRFLPMRSYVMSIVGERGMQEWVVLVMYSVRTREEKKKEKKEQEKGMPGLAWLEYTDRVT